MLVRLSVIAALSVVTVQGADVKTNFSGYLVDYYCYSLCDVGSIGLDGSNVIEGPNEHTMHCLRDVPQCRDGFFLAAKRGQEGYRIKFKLDDASYNAALALLDSFPKGHEFDDQPLQVTAVGMHDGGGYLKNAVIQLCSTSGAAACDGVCHVESGTCDTPDDLDFTIKPGVLLIMHAICMSLSWGCLLPLGVLWAHNLRKHPAKPGGVPVWFQGHRIMQSTGVFLQFLGFIFILLWKKSSHFKLAHEIIGLVVVVLGCLQPVNAAIRNLKCIGHPHPDGTRPLPRKIWEIVHKGCGYTATLLGMINVILGPVHANNLRFDRALVLAAAIFVALSLGIIVCGGIVLEVRRAAGYAELGAVSDEKDNVTGVVIGGKDS